MSSPAFQFYPADYLADAKVQTMSIEGEGCYFRLLCYCWREGSIPSDRAAIVRLCKGYDGPGIDEAMALFVRGDKRGTLVHRRLDKERKRQEALSKAMQEAGLRGAIKRWKLDGLAIEKPMAKNGSSLSPSPSSLNPPTPFEKGGGRKPNNRRTRRLDVGSTPSDKDAAIRRASERNLKNVVCLKEGE